MSNDFILQEWAKAYSVELATPITYQKNQSSQPPQATELSDSELAKFTEYLMVKACAYEKLSEWAKAKECYLDALRLLNCDHSGFVENYNLLKIQILSKLGEANVNLQQWSEAKKCYLIVAGVLRKLLNVNFVNSQKLDDFGRILCDLGAVNMALQKWLEAIECFLEAVNLYKSMGTNFIKFTYTETYIKIQFNLSITYLNLQKWQEARECLLEVVDLYTDLGAYSVEHPEISNSLIALNNLGVVNLNLLRLLEAEECYLKATKLYRILGADSAGSVLAEDFVKGLVNLSIVYCQLKNLVEVKKLSEEAIKVFKKINYYSSDFNFTEFLTSLSHNFQELPVNISQPAHDLVKIALRWLKFQPPDSNAFSNNWQIPLDDTVDDAILLQQLETAYQAASTNLASFWQCWLDCALDHNDGAFLLDIIGVLHARRLQTLLNLNIKLTGALDDDQRHYVKLEIQKEQIPLKKSTMELALKNATDEDKKQHVRQQLHELTEQAQQIFHEWLSVHNKLIEQGRGFDANLIQTRSDQLREQGLHFDTDTIQTRSHELRAQLAPDQAVVISVNLADYGLAEQPPRLLLIRRESISWLLLSIRDVNLDVAVETLTDINRAMNSGRNRLSLRTSEATEPQDVTSESDIESLQQTLKATMTGCWQKLSEQLPDCTQISFIGHGHLVGLPWQGYAPPQFEVSYYSGLYAYHQRKSIHAISPVLVPTATSPLTLLAYADEDHPEKRLYHLPAEIAAIEHIWGKECVEHLNNLREAKPHHNLLLLLGHGDYGDGLARFLLKNKILEQHDLMNYPHPLRFLGTSACLLGSEKDIGGEPLGLLSLCGCRHDMAFSYGSLLPVDDLSAVCLSILFHCHWQKCSDPQAAIKLALSQLASGQWDESAKIVFRTVFTDYLPSLFIAIEEVEKQLTDIEERCGKSEGFDSNHFKVMNKRHDGIRKVHKGICDDWGIGNGGKPIFGRYYRQFIDCDEDETAKQNAAQQLVEAFLIKATTDKLWLSKLATFTSFWMYS